MLSEVVPPGDTTEGDAVADVDPAVPIDPVVPAPVVPTAPVAPAPIDPVDAVPAVPPIPGGLVTPGVVVVEGGGSVPVCVLVVADEPTLPGCMEDGPIVGLIIVIGPEPTPPPMHPDMVIVPVVEEPAVCGADAVVVCANVVAAVANNIEASSESCIDISYVQ